MLTPEYLQGAPAELEALFLRLEEEVIKDICRRIAKEGRLTDSAADQAERLRDLGAGTDYIKRKISEYSELSSEEVDRLFFDAAQTSDEFYRNVYAKTNKEYTPYEYNDYFQQAVDAAVNQTKGELRNLTQSMGFSYRGSNGQVRFHTAAEAYRDCLDYAFLQTSTGMTDYNTAVRNATRRLTESGLQFVDYASGVRNHADVAVRRAVLTGLSQYTGKISERNAQELDTDIVEVSAHMGARPDHAEWQGRWYSLSGKSKKYPSLVEVTGYGTGAGLKGWNCRHDFYPVIPGISEPSYTEEELRNIDPPPFEYNGKTYTCYEATQRQRYMERTMRKTKRELLAADSTGDKDRFTEKSVFLRRQREEYGKFSKAAGLLTQNERTQVGGFGHSQASKAAWTAKKAQTASGGSSAPVPATGGSSGGNVQNYLNSGLTSGGGSGIMKMGKVKGAYKQTTPDFTKYEITDDIQSVNTARNLLISEFGIAESDIDFSGIRNAEVLKPFSERLVKIKNVTGLGISKIKAAKIIDGDECCIASYKPFERTLYISSRYFNSEQALTDTLKDWANNGIMPKQCTTIRYLAEHEAAHIRIPDSVIRSEEAIKIWKKRKLINDNDSDIYEYYADAVAIYKTSSKYDTNIQNAIEYLIKEGVKI